MIRMMDTIGSNVHNIPTSAPKVAGYVTGFSVVPWDISAWNLFPNSGHIRIKQHSGDAHILDSDVIDVETGACTPDDVVTYVRERIASKIQWSTIYGTLTTLQACFNALHTHMGTTFYGHVDCWLADWNLNEAQATALLADTHVNRQVAGMTCRAVQWASPQSNPHTLVPGTNMTLSTANIDLSVTQNEWYAHGSNWNRK